MVAQARRRAAGPASARQPSLACGRPVHTTWPEPSPDAPCRDINPLDHERANPLAQERLGEVVIAIGPLDDELVIHERLESPLHAGGRGELVLLAIAVCERFARLRRQG